MTLLETKALVLDARDYRETSKLIALLTPDRGTVHAVAKGAHRRNSTLAALLQPFSLLAVRMTVRASGGLANLTSADSVERPDYAANPADALARMAYAAFYAEALASTPENDPHSEELFPLACRFFRDLARAPHAGSFALRGFFELLSALGYAPNLGESAGEATAPAKRRYVLNILEGAVEPASHGDRGRVGFPLDGEQLDALRSVMKSIEAGGAGEAFIVGRSAGAHLMRLAIRLFEVHLERSMRSGRFLEEMTLGK